MQNSKSQTRVLYLLTPAEMVPRFSPTKNDIFEPAFRETKNNIDSSDFDGSEVSLLADCVWFVCSISKHLLVQPVSLVPHITLHTLARYVVTTGVKLSLIETDRILLAAACFQIASKLTSQHCKPDAIIEFLYTARPLENGV